MPSNSVPIVNTSRQIDPPSRLILLLRSVTLWLSRRQTRLELERLSDRQLSDIGLERRPGGYRATPGSPASRYRDFL